MSLRFWSLLLIFLLVFPLLSFLLAPPLLSFLVGGSASATPLTLSNDRDIVSGCGHGESEGFWVGGPNLRIRQDGPGVAFGMIKPPTSETKEYAYVVVLKDIHGKITGGFQGGSSSDDRSAAHRIRIGVADGWLEIKYKTELNTQTRKVTSETFTINGKDLDPRKGRVLLVSWTGKEFTWQQVAAELPKKPEHPLKTEEMETMAKDLVQRLQRENLAVRTFLSPTAAQR